MYFARLPSSEKGFSAELGSTLVASFVAYCELVTALATASIQNTLTVLGLHTGPEAMLIPSFPLTGLKCPLHLF